MGFSLRTRCRLYALIWWTVALVLLIRSWPYIVELDGTGHTVIGMPTVFWAMTLSASLGWIKGRTALRKSALRALCRLRSSGDIAGLGSLWDWSTIVLVACMSCLGIVLRNGNYDIEIKIWVISVVYPAVSIALVMGGWTVFFGRAEPTEEF